MNYYSHHIGDYLTDTAHLSILEDGAYRRLMDKYYTSEAPLSLDEAALFRQLRARSDDEKEAIRVVLSEFFIQTEAGWSHKRCDQEIAIFKEKSGKAADAANKRWNKPSNANGMPAHTEGNADALLTNNQEPLTNPINQEPKEKPAPKRNRKSTSTPLPADFAISQRVIEWAFANHYSNLQAHFDNFVSACKAKGYTYADWDEGFMGAIRKDWAKLAPARASPAGYESAKDKSRRETNEALTGRSHEQRTPDFIDIN